MDMDEKENTYEKVPHQGQEFEEGGKTFYWTFADAAIGEHIERTARGAPAYRGKSWQEDENGNKINETEGWCHYDQFSKTNVTAVEKSEVDGKPIVKWECGPGHGDTTNAYSPQKVVPSFEEGEDGELVLTQAVWFQSPPPGIDHE